MDVFYSTTIEESRISLEEEESHHCIKVLRNTIGNELRVTDGAGKLYFARIIDADPRKTVLEILRIEKEELRPQPCIHIAIAPTKNIDRFEWFLEKATEIGVSEITPIVCQRSERDKIKPERLEKILVGAMKQSARLCLPKLNSITKLKDVVNHQSPVSTQKFICHCQSPNLPAITRLYNGANVLMLIGPEGDFTRDEITLAEEAGFVSASLGEARLRTETAGIVAVHTIKLLNESSERL